MAEKKVEKKTSKVIQVLKTEYPFEGILLGFLGILVLILGVYIFESRVITIRFTDLFIFATELRIKIFATLVMIVGAGALLMAFAPFIIPGLKEMRRVSWPTRKTMINHSMRVFGFIIFLGIMFILYDGALRPLFTLIKGGE